MGSNKLIKLFATSFFQRIVNFMIKPKYGWIKIYHTWQEAQNKSTGYNADIIIEKVTNALISVKNGQAIYERDSCLFDKVKYSFPLLASLLWIASKNNNKLSIVDFGGSLGSSYFQNKLFLEHLNELHWNIIEQAKFVDKGKQYFENKQLTFYYNLNDCLEEQNCDTLFISSTLEYIEKPYELLNQLLAANFKYIIIDRTLFVNSDEDIIALQKVSPDIYNASYPCWMFNQNKFLSYFIGYDLMFDFSSNFGQINIHGLSAEHRGMLFVKKEVVK